jgi:superfamily II DNA or RNA helicase
MLLLILKALGAGERWITVKAPGHEKGQPVLIKPSDDGSFKVIGGAGGKLNHLRLTGVKSEADYKREAGQRDVARKEERKRQAERDKKDGLAQSKGAAKEAIKAQLGLHQATFVQTVAKAMGWKDDELRFPEEQYQNVSEQARAKAARQHAQGVLRKARDAVQHQRQRLVADAEARQEANLGEVPLSTSSPETLSVQDLDPVEPSTKGFGFAPQYAKRAEERGLTKTELAAEAEAAKPPPTSDGKPDPAIARKATQEKIAAELQDIRDPAPAVSAQHLVDAKQAVELLKAEKVLRAVQKDAREKTRLIEGAREKVEPKAYVLETGGPADADVTKDLENDLRTIRTRAFLDEVGRSGGGSESIGRHIAVGGYNAVNALALAAGGASLVDRSVVDVLGIAGAAQVVARRLQTDLTPDELENVREAMGRFHVDRYMDLSDQALREAREWHEMAHEIEIGEAASGADLVVAQELNAKRREFVQKAQSVLGTSLGEMEANAALVLALDQPPKDKIDVSLGKVPIEEAIRQARAIGLERGDYQIERVGASTILTVKGAGMNRIAQPIDRADLESTKAALDIINGHADEDDWLPEGFARRPDLAMNPEPGVAPRLAKPFPARPADMKAAIESYIGGRSADGDAPADIMADLLSEDTLQKAGDRKAFMDALDDVAPLYDKDGKMVRAEAHQKAFERMADSFVEREHGGKLAPLHRQKIEVDQVAVDALHRALAAHPEGVVAFKSIGDLTPQDQNQIRKEFAKEYGRADPAAEAMRSELERLDQAEPEKEVEDMFGRGVNPAWREWQTRRNDMAEKLNAASMTWSKYVTAMGSPANAMASMQDVIRSNVVRAFADQHNRLRPGTPLKVGKTVIANDLNHLDALDPVARERREKERRDLADSLRNRVAGKYAAGSVSEKLDAARQADEAAAQAQMGLFGATETPAEDGTAPQAKPLQLGERATIGHAAERQIAGMMPIVGRNFRPGEPQKIWQPTMAGKYVERQRAVKLIENNGHTVLGMGTGSGKTGIMLGAFTHLQAKGKAHRGLFVVPSVVQGQFHGTALQVLEPGKFDWHADPSASREERIAAYKDPKKAFSVVTKEAFRDDMLHLAARRDGTTPGKVADKLVAMKPAERATYMRDLLKAEGIDHDYFAADEAQALLNREGKKDSRLAAVIDGITDNMPFYVSASADPVKNDPSEAFDILSKMDRKRYSDRAAFMRKYGVNTAASQDGLRREMARHFYTAKIDPGVKANKTEVKVDLDEGQHAALAKVQDAARRGRLARMKGTVDVDAMRELSPGSFKSADPAQHEAIAENLQRSIGIVQTTAVQHIVDGNSKTEALAKIAAERKGKSGVVFAHNLANVQAIADRLKKDGHRVVTLTGGDSSAQKDSKKREFQDGLHDILVASDAGAVGANLQKGKWLAQYDTPMTAMLHHQRGARIHRMGQTQDVELMDLIANHPSERRNRARLASKYELRDIMTSPLEGLDDSGLAGYLHRVQAGKMEAEQPMHMPVAADHEGQPAPADQASMF